MAEAPSLFALKFPLEDEGRTPARITFDVQRINASEVSFEGGSEPVSDPDSEDASPGGRFFDNFRGTEFGGLTVGERVGQISLFLPPEISFQDGVAFDEVSFDSLAGRTALGALESGNSFTVGSLLGDVAESSIDAVRSLFSGGEAARAVALRVAQNSGNREASGIASLATQTAINPNKRVIFKSVNLRTFQFTFTMIPTSPEEAEAVKQIVKRFRTELYPEEISATVGGTTVPFGYKFPNRFLISFVHAGRPIATKLKPAYLDNVSTSYNKGGAGFFPDGNFTETTISLSFKEYSTLNRQDVEEGGF